jgi:hypothetical protein
MDGDRVPIDEAARVNAPAAFVVRVVRDPSGGLTGIVERMRTGAKARFEGASAIGPLIARMLAEADDPATREEETL